MHKDGMFHGTGVLNNGLTLVPMVKRQYKKYRKWRKCSYMNPTKYMITDQMVTQLKKTWFTLNVGIQQSYVQNLIWRFNRDQSNVIESAWLLAS
jgi:hypothetical protein